jgi:molecular chaperone DnaK
MHVLGIDFGTSNTVAMVRVGDGRIRPLLFDGSPLLPSAVYLNTDGRMLVGRDAERNARLDPSRFEPNPKRRIDDGQLLLGDTELAVPGVFGHVFGHIAEEVRRQLAGSPTDVRLTHPAQWGERRRSLLVEAARRANLPTPRLIPEPVGAASYFTAMLGTSVPTGRSLAVYDLGGGTFDATVVRRTQGGFEVLAEEGLVDVGGLDFDHAIVEYLGRTYGATHPERWGRLINPVDQNDRRQRRLLYEDVRGVKEMLSRTTSADIPLPALEVDARLTRAELEQLVRGPLERTVACLRQAIGSARMEPKDLVGIFLVGGSSRIPLAAQLLRSELGVAPTTLEQPETVVVEGALCIGASGPTRSPVSGPPRTSPVSTPPARPQGGMARPNAPMPGPGQGMRPPGPAGVGQGRPASGPPANPGPGGFNRVGPGRPAMVPGPRSTGYPGRPVPAPQGRPVPVPPVRSMPVAGPQRMAPVARRRFAEPGVIATIVVLVLIAVAFIVLLVAALP